MTHFDNGFEAWVIDRTEAPYIATCEFRTPWRESAEVFAAEWNEREAAYPVGVYAVVLPALAVEPRAGLVIGASYRSRVTGQEYRYEGAIEGVHSFLEVSGLAAFRLTAEEVAECFGDSPDPLAVVVDHAAEVTGMAL